MKRNPSFGRAPETGAFFSKGERNRLIFLSVLLVAVLVVFVGALMQTGKYERASSGELPQEEPFNEQVVLAQFDASLVAGKVADAERGDRVLLESEPFDALFRFAAEQGQVYFRALGARELDATTYDALTARPAEHRAQPYLARGYLEQLELRTRPDGLPEHRGWLRLESGKAVHFALRELPEGLISDDFVRVDGLFLKIYDDEGPQGWVEGPLLVGAGAVRSYPRPEEVAPTPLKAQLKQVPDDTVAEFTELQGESFDAQWLLMEHARALHTGEADWMLREPKRATGEVGERPEEEGVLALEPGPADWASATSADWEPVPEIDNALLAEIIKDGEKYRGRPFRIPVSKNMAAYTMDPGENPARLDLVTEGWIGNTTWTAQSGLVKFQMPRPAPELQNVLYVTGKGFFLKNLAYVPERGGLNIVPFFVMTSVEPFVPAEDSSVQYVLYGVAGITILLVVLIPVLLLRDRRRSQALQRELVRRRRERRERSGQTSQSSA